jgi:ketosteroid isomerase-like protein
MKDTIFSLEKAAMKRWRNGDPMAWAELSTDDVIYIDPGLTAPIVGLDNYSAFLEQLKGQIHYEVSEFIDPCIEIVGEAAVLSYNYRSKPTAQSPDQMLWNATEVYFCQDGQWRIVHTHWSFVHHQRPQVVDVPVPVSVVDTAYEGVLGELMALESAAMERWRKGDPWGFIDISAPQITYFDTGTPQRINGREALRAEYATREGKIFYDVMDFIAPQVRVHGDLAVMPYRFFSTVLNPDGSIRSRMPWNCTEVFARVDGQWKAIHTHWSFIRGEQIKA